jgi:hypothetical protein
MSHSFRNLKANSHITCSAHAVPLRMVAAHYKQDDPLNCWSSSSVISVYYADLHEGYGTSEHGRGAEWHGHGIVCVCVNWL